MNMTKFNSKREIVRQLVRSHLECYKLYEDMEALKITAGPLAYIGEHQLDLALDLIGFPLDDTNEDEESTFCRDWLHEAVPTEVRSVDIEAETSRLVDFYLSEYETLKNERPDLFQ